MNHGIAAIFLSIGVGTAGLAADAEPSGKSLLAPTAVTETAREVARQAKPSAKTAFQRDGSRVRLLNEAVLVSLDEATGSWNTIWLGSVKAAVLGACFSVEVDGQVLRPAGTKGETESFSDALGTGIQFTQTWGERVRVERRIRVYDGLPAVTVSGRITNRSSADVSLGTAQMLDLSPTSQNAHTASNAR